MNLARDLTELLNKHSVENASDTPDFVLAIYLLACLEAFGRAVKRRDSWFADSEAHKPAKNGNLPNATPKL